MKFISGIFGGKKENGNFFLELKDEPDEPMPNSASQAVVQSNNGVKPATTVKAEETPSNNAPAEKKTAEKKTAKKKTAKTAAPVENKVEEYKRPQPVEKKVEEPKETSFASKYLIPKNDNMRRRPGANMNSFLDMASKVKTPIAK